MTNSEGGTDDEEFRVAAVVDRVNTTMQVWMGLTMGCAQCHSHKYDPISQTEYYRVLAVFNNTADADRGDEAPTLTDLTPSQRRAQQRLDEQIGQLQQPPTGGTAEVQTDVDLQERLAALEKQRQAIQGVQTQAFPLQTQARQVGGIEHRVGRGETNGLLAGKHQAHRPRGGASPEHQLDAVGAVAPVTCEQESGNAGHPIVRSENLMQLPRLGLSRKGDVGFTPGLEAWPTARPTGRRTSQPC